MDKYNRVYNKSSKNSSADTQIIKNDYRIQSQMINNIPNFTPYREKILNKGKQTKKDKIEEIKYLLKQIYTILDDLSND